MPAALVIVFACVCGLSVANVYYAQPLLDAIAHDFGIPTAAAGSVVTATQVGCGTALLFVVPLGDRFDRRRLLLTQLFLLAVALMLTGCAQTLWMLMTGVIAVGLFGTAMTQGMIAFSANLATPAQRGRTVGIVASGVVVGLLLARTFAGIVSDAFGWRAVYRLSAGISLVMLLGLWKLLPSSPPVERRPSYRALLSSMCHLLWNEPVLQRRGVLGMLMFASLSAFWTSLVLPLRAPPYSLTHSVIGAFGLAGMAGALAAARAGRLADQGRGESTTGVGAVLLLLGWALAALLDRSLVLLIIGVILLDMGAQAIHVVNQSMIFCLRPEAQSRLVGCYMLFYAIGSAVGGIASTFTYARNGWLGVCALGMGISGVTLVYWAGTLRAARRPKESGTPTVNQ